ncbi:MAG: hypothetical protein Q9191_004157 [Dirinaria sp. TL-2023a]
MGIGLREWDGFLKVVTFEDRILVGSTVYEPITARRKTESPMTSSMGDLHFYASGIELRVAGTEGDIGPIFVLLENIALDYDIRLVSEVGSASD